MHERTGYVDSQPLIEIEKLRNPMRTLISKMREPITNSSYSFMISDNRGAYIPSIILHGVINRFQATMHRPGIPIIGVDGSKYEANIPNMQSQFKERAATFHNVHIEEATTILIVTEYISSGKSIANLSSVFVDHPVNIEVAAVMSQNHEEDYMNKSKLPSVSRMYVGRVGGLPKIIDRHNTFGLSDKKYSSPMHLLDPKYRLQAKHALMQTQHLTEELYQDFINSV